MKEVAVAKERMNQLIHFY